MHLYKGQPKHYIMGYSKELSLNETGLQIRVCIGTLFSLFLIQNIYVVGTQNTCLNCWVRKNKTILHFLDLCENQSYDMKVFNNLCKKLEYEDTMKTDQVRQYVVHKSN